MKVYTKSVAIIEQNKIYSWWKDIITHYRKKFKSFKE